MRTPFQFAAACLIAAAAGWASGQTVLSPAFAYQGRLSDGGLPANGAFTMDFRLFDAATFGTQIGATISLPVAVADGLFTVQLNAAGQFGPQAFDGQQRFLEVTVNGTRLAPRQPLAAAPYAQTAATALGVAGIDGHSLDASDGAPQDAVFVSAAGNVGIGTTAPLLELDVVRTTAANNINPVAVFRQAGAGQSAGAVRFQNSAGNSFNIGITPQNDLGLGYNANISLAGDLLRITSSGNVGLGTTAPASRLDVAGTGRMTGFQLTTGAAAGRYLVSDGGGTGSWQPLSLAGLAAGGDLSGSYPNPTIANDAVTATKLAFDEDSLKQVSGNVMMSANGRIGVGPPAPTHDARLDVLGQNGSTAIWAQVDSLTGFGVVAVNTGTTGNAFGGFFQSNSPSGIALRGFCGATAGTNYGVRGATTSPDGFAVFADGDFGGSGAKYFRIDHPFDPANRYLHHYCAEGPEPLNIYSGTAALDAQGAAAVQLPDYFDAINRDARVQLTAAGAAMPGLHVAVEPKDNCFQIGGGAPGGKVYWEVKGVRNDLWMRSRARPVEQDKPEHERGTYQHPELYGQTPRGAAD